METIFKKVLTILIVLIVISASIPAVYAEGSLYSTSAEGTEGISVNMPRRNSGVVTWDCVWFGAYPQNSDSVTDVSPIKWRVMSVMGDYLYLISDKVLDETVVNFDATENISEPAKTDLGRYLSTTFVNKAFTSEEREAITEIAGARKVWLFSTEELLYTSYGFSENRSGDLTRCCQATPYAIAQGVIASTAGEGPYKNTCSWWLRNLDYRSEAFPNCLRGAVVTASGAIPEETDWPVVTESGIGLRPVINIRGNVNCVYPAGTVSSDGTVNEIEAPQPQETGSGFLEGPFDVSDMYGFDNPAADPPKKAFQKFYGKTKGKAIWRVDTGCGLAHAGLCNGMVTTAMASLLQNSPEPSSYGKESLYYLDTGKEKSSTTNISALDYCEYGQAVQYDPTILTQRQRNHGNMYGLYDAVKKFASGDTTEPVLIRIGDSKGHGHMLWGLGIEYSNKDCTAIAVYDCNWHGENRCLFLNKNDGRYVSWEYDMKPDRKWIGRIGEASVDELTFDTCSAQMFVLLYAEKVHYETGDYNLLLTIDPGDCDMEWWNEWYDNTCKKQEGFLPALTGSGDESSSKVVWCGNGNDELKLSDVPAGVEITCAGNSDYFCVKADHTCDMTFYGDDPLEELELSSHYAGSTEYSIDYYRPDEHSNDAVSVNMDVCGDDITVYQCDDKLDVLGAESVFAQTGRGTENENGWIEDAEVIGVYESELDPSDSVSINSALYDESSKQDINDIYENGLSSIKALSKVYTGEDVLVKVNLIDTDRNNYRLREGVDYIVSYDYNDSVGPALATITGIGSYTGDIYYPYDILPKGTSVKKLKAAKRSLKVSWKKQTLKTRGYQIQISTDKKFKKNRRTITVKGNKNTSKSIKKLRSRKRYYVRVRTWTRADGSIKYYSPWSSVKSVKTK